jgi:hypothetical protein
VIDTLLSALERSRGWDAAALVVVSFTVYLTAANLAWRAQSPNAGAFAARLRQAAAQPGPQAAFQFARLGYYIGLPFLALYMGWVDVRSLGLAGFEWTEGIRYAIVILLAAWLLMIIIWLPYLRATSQVDAPTGASRSFPRRVVELVFMQAHWAFYRAAAIVFLNRVVPDPYYWGSILGLALVALEAFTSPFVRRQLTRPGEADGIVWSGGQAVINTLSFLATRNLFLLIAIQFLLELTVPHLRSNIAPARAAAPTSPPPPVPNRSRQGRT